MDLFAIACDILELVDLDELCVISFQRDRRNDFWAAQRRRWPCE